MKIGIVEVITHQIFLYTLSLIAKEVGADVTIFTNENLYNLVSPLFKNKIKNYRWIIKREDQSMTSFLKQVEKIANKEIDLLFVNTLGGNLCFQSIFFKPKCKSILVDGSLTEWFENKYKPNTFQPRGFIGYNMRYFSRKVVLRRFNSLVVHAESLKDYVLANGYKKDIFVLPFTIYDGSTPLKIIGKKLKFIVAGMIEEHRRDYDGLLKAFKKIWNHGYKDVNLTILGRPIGEYGEKIINQCRLLKEQGFDVQFYNDYIPEEIYKDEVISADVIINPIKLEYYLYGGFTAGLVGAIMHAKPGIYPANYIVPKELLSSSLFYDEINKLDYLIEQNFLNNNRGILEKLSKNAKENSEKYSLQQLTITFRDLCRRIFNNEIIDIKL